MDKPSIISKLSIGFITRYRVTILLLIGTLVLGLFSYTTLLKREGFPPIELPVAIIQTPYFVGNIEAVDAEVTTPIETAIGDIPEIEGIVSTTTENFSVIQVQFSEGTSSEEGAKKLKEEISNSNEVSSDLDITYSTFNAGAIDGENDLIFTISGDRTTEELQAKAEAIAPELEELDVVLEVNVKKVITTEINPATGEEVENKSGFNRVGYKENGELKFDNAISIGIKKRGDDTGTIELSTAVRDKIAQLKEEGQLKGYDIHFGSGDFAEALKAQIGSLESNIQAGLVAVIIVLFLFVNWRASLVTALFIPTVLAATFVGLYLIGYSLNVLSLFGLILVLGLFVDDAIVVVEAIDYYKKQGVKGIQAVKKAINAVGAADISGTLTTLLVFFPMAMISGVLGDFIKLIPVTVILALILSLLIALTLIPVTANIFIPAAKKSKKQNAFEKAWNYLINGFPMLVNKVGDLTSRFVRLYLSNPITPFLVIIVSILMIVFGVSFAGKLEFSIFPPPKDAEAITVSLSYQEGTTVDQAEAIAKKVEKALENTAEEYVKSVDYFQSSPRGALLSVNLSALNERDVTSVEIAEDLRREVEDFDDVSIKIDQSSAGPPTSDFQFFVQVYAEDIDVLETATEDIAQFLEDRKVNDEVTVTEIVTENLESISKLDGRRFAQVKAKISDPQDTAAVLELIDQVKARYDEDRLDNLELNEDALGFDLGQESENLESFNSAVFSILIALILMYGLLVFQFNSFTQPLLIFTAIPFAFVGLFPGLVATEQYLSFFVMIGLTGLIGIVVNNTIMLIDFANQARAEGKGIVDSIVEATRIRFRPLLTTSVTTVAGLLPLALSDPFWEAISFTIIFGLVSSTVMVILVFPAYYAVLEKLRDLKSKAATKVGVSMN